MLYNKHSVVSNTQKLLVDRLTAKFNQFNINPKIVKTEEIPLSKLKSNLNGTRFTGEDAKSVTSLVEIINNGEYDPERYIPPIVESNIDNNYIIISGHHRYHAHLNVGRDKMFSVVVKFACDRDREVWRAAENVKNIDGYYKNPSSEIDQVNHITRLIHEGIIDSDRNSIESFIIDSGIHTKKAEKSVNNLVNKVLKNIGNHVDYVRSWENTEKKDVIAKLEKVLPDRKFISATFKELDDVDYDNRAMMQAIDSFVNEPNKPISIVYAINGADKDKIEKIRKHKPKSLVSQYFDIWKKVFDLYEQGHDIRKMVNFEPLPQLGCEIQDADNGVTSFVNSIKMKYSEKEVIEQIFTYINNGDSELKNRLKKLLLENESDKVSKFF